MDDETLKFLYLLSAFGLNILALAKFYVGINNKILVLQIDMGYIKHELGIEDRRKDCANIFPDKAA